MGCRIGITTDLASRLTYFDVTKFTSFLTLRDTYSTYYHSNCDMAMNCIFWPCLFRLVANSDLETVLEPNLQQTLRPIPDRLNSLLLMNFYSVALK